MTMPDDVTGVQDLFPGKRQNQNFRLTYSATRMAKIVTTAVGINASRNRQIICDTADMLPAIIVPTIFGITDFVIFWSKNASDR